MKKSFDLMDPPPHDNLGNSLPGFHGPHFKIHLLKGTKGEPGRMPEGIDEGEAPGYTGKEGLSA